VRGALASQKSTCYYCGVVSQCYLLGSFTSDDAKSVRELKELLSNNMAARSKAESDKMVMCSYIIMRCILKLCFSFFKALAERMDQLEEMLSKKEKFLLVRNAYNAHVHMYTNTHALTHAHT